MEKALGILLEPAAQVITQVLNDVFGKKDNQSGNQAQADERYNQLREQNAELTKQLENYQEQHKSLIHRFDTLLEQMHKKKIETFDDLAQQDREAKQKFIELAQETKPHPLSGYNIGLFGLTSTGKSTMLNSLLGEKKAATGAGETTIEVTAYPGQLFTLWDVPGRNDEISYLSMQYISFFKGLSKRMILVYSTLKENSSLMKMLDAINIKYDIVLNKFDQVDEDEREALKTKIHSEVTTLGLKGVQKIYFVSAKRPNMFPDWLTLVNDLTS